MPRLFALLPLLVLAGCGPKYSPDTYAGSAVQQAAKVEQGVVVGVRSVSISAQGTTGAITGGAAGGVVGSQLPAGSSVGSALGAIGGSLLGGIVGSTVERTTGETLATEYIVRKPNGDLVSVTQQDQVPLGIGTRVLVIAGSQARIVPDYTVPIDPPAPPVNATPGDERPPAPVVEET